jgi:hypothetical protein
MDLYQKMGLISGTLFVGLGAVVALTYSGGFATIGAFLLGGYGVLVAGLAFRHSRQQNTTSTDEFDTSEPPMGGESVATVADSEDASGPQPAGDGLEGAARSTDRTPAADAPSDE